LPAETTLWNRCIRDLQAEIPEQQFNTWIRPLQAVEDDGVLRLLAPNRFVVDWLREHYIERIVEIVDSSDVTAEVIVEVGSRRAAAASTAAPPRPSAPRQSAPAALESRLSPGFTFDTFVEGKSNQLAKAAATQVGSNPGKSYNPLFIADHVTDKALRMNIGDISSRIARQHRIPDGMHEVCFTQAHLPLAGRAAD